MNAATSSNPVSVDFAVDDISRQPRLASSFIQRDARQHKLLGPQIASGGSGAAIFDITEMCYALGRACLAAEEPAG